MTERKKYVVDIDSMEVKDVLVGRGTEYEIIANDDEVDEIETHFSQMKADSIDSVKHILYPFNEKDVDKNRESYHNHVIDVFRLIQSLGTEKTKMEIDSLKLFE